MNVKQNILLSSANKSVITDLNNDIRLNFPSDLFFKAPQILKLVNFDLNCEIITLGPTNNTLFVIYTDDTNVLRTYKVVVPFSSSIKVDYDLAQAVQTALNAIDYDNYDISFTVNESSVTNVITNFKVESDATTSAYIIQSTLPCTISFKHKDSIGPLMGFGSGIYTNLTTFTSTATQSIATYNYIDVYNESGDTGVFPNYSDYNCKMALFNSNGDYIANSNTNNPYDPTISIHSNASLVHYDSMGKLLITIQNAMNAYSTYYTPHANFYVSYNFETNKVTITNKTGATFGIGFDFENISNTNTSGSLHSVLGFEQKSYLNVVSITSTLNSLVFENCFSDDYILFCSDISNNSTDLNIIGIGNADNIKSNGILFAIPFAEVKHFTPKDTDYYKIDISSSAFSLGYKNHIFNENNINQVNIYLRTLSGRCVSSNCQWTALISFEF